MEKCTNISAASFLHGVKSKSLTICPYQNFCHLLARFNSVLKKILVISRLPFSSHLCWQFAKYWSTKLSCAYFHWLPLLSWLWNLIGLLRWTRNVIKRKRTSRKHFRLLPTSFLGSSFFLPREIAVGLQQISILLFSCTVTVVFLSLLSISPCNYRLTLLTATISHDRRQIGSLQSLTESHTKLHCTIISPHIELLPTASILCQANKWWEFRKPSTKGHRLHIPQNSQNKRQKKCLPISQEIWYFEFGNKTLTVSNHHARF